MNEIHSLDLIQALRAGRSPRRLARKLLVAVSIFVAGTAIAAFILR